MALRRLALGLSLMMVLGVAGTAAQEKVGKVSFATSCNSFWFPASVAAFTAVAQSDPGCGMAHWGIAMNALGNPFAWPPSAKGLADGWAAVEKAKAAGAKTQRERDYIAAIETFYKDAATERPELRQAKTFLGK